MIITEKEKADLLYVRDKCKGKLKDLEVCTRCPYFEGYCHFAYYLDTCVKEA